jgi:hypothetical protein
LQLALPGGCFFEVFDMFDMVGFAWAVVAIAITLPLVVLFVSREGD